MHLHVYTFQKRYIAFLYLHSFLYTMALKDEMGGPSTAGCWCQRRCAVCWAAIMVLFVLVMPTSAATADKTY